MSESRYPQPTEAGKCIGCGKELPKPKNTRPFMRRTWCSEKCRLEHCGLGFQGYVKKRALGYCEICSIDLVSDSDSISVRLDLIDADIWQWHWRTSGIIHHIIPYAKGGAHHVDNLQLLCKACHKAAHKKLREIEHERKIQSDRV